MSTLLPEGIALLFKAEAAPKVRDTVHAIYKASRSQGMNHVRAAVSCAGLLPNLPELYREVCEAIKHLLPQDVSECESAKEVPLIDASIAQYSQAIRNTIQYMREHLGEQSLSLNHIATDVLYLNPDYLGRLFKRECGIKFSDYLLMLRMEKAKQLIVMSPDMKIYEVAEQVGLGNNAAYFGQVFKKYTNILPSEYRDLHSRGHHASSGRALDQ